MPQVRPEEPQDYVDIRVVHERAFAPSREEADLVEALRASGARVHHGNAERTDDEQRG